MHGCVLYLNASVPCLYELGIQNFRFMFVGQGSHVVFISVSTEGEKNLVAKLRPRAEPVLSTV